MTNEYKYNKINTSAISFSDVKTIQMSSGNNRKQVYMNYSNGKFLVETPELYFPFGLYEDQLTDNSGTVIGHKYSLTASLGKKEIQSNAEFQNLLEEINVLVQNACQENSLMWLGKNYGKTEISVLYNNMIKKYRDRDTGEETGKFPDTFRVKLPYYDGKFDCKVFDKSDVKNKLEDSAIKSNLAKGSKGKLLIQSNGVYFASGKFGISWKLIQAKITPSKNMTDYAFLSSDEDD